MTQEQLAQIAACKKAIKDMKHHNLDKLLKSPAFIAEENKIKAIEAVCDHLQPNGESAYFNGHCSICFKIL